MIQVFLLDVKKNWDNSIFVGIILNVLLRWTVSRFPYSGFRKPPLFGDYEAQRHWMEVTFNLSPNEWYINSTKNDLEYWGIDYPPLTAYHSLINGYIANRLNSSWIALNTSRGIETYYHKIFMRSTVLFIDLMIYFTGVILFWLTEKSLLSNRTRSMCITLSLMYPGLILIDHGHFQYNCVSLGLTIWSIVMLMKDQHFFGSILFTLAINYKQISLYHSLPFFFYLLGVCSKQSSLQKKLVKFFIIAIAVILTFTVCWLPFLMSNTILDVLARLFPFYRGLYEDKVANIWCSLEILIKLKQLVNFKNLAILSFFVTFICLLPNNIHLLLNPSIRNFQHSLINSSLIFFLFSFQVHEKNILLVSSVVMLLMCQYPLTTLWFFYISSFSLQPLLTKDGLLIPYYAVTLFFFIIYSAFYKDMKLSETDNAIRKARTLFFVGSLTLGVFLSLCSSMLKPPKRYPDLFTVANAIFNCIHFLAFAGYYHYLQFYHDQKGIYTKLKSH